MSYIRARVRNGRTYYYLVESVREGRKVRQKTLMYLGTTPPTIGKASQSPGTPARDEIRAERYECLRCGHKWEPDRKDRYPKRCPKCSTPYWDRPRERKPKGVK